MSTATATAEALRLEGVHKAFGDFVALKSIDLVDAAGRARLLPRPVGVRQDDAAADHRRTGAADARPHRAERPRRVARAAGRARLRHRVPVVRAVPESDDPRQRRVRARQPPQGSRADIAARVERTADAGRPARRRRRSIRARCRAASSSALRSRARWRHRRRCCCSTSRCRRSMPRSASGCAARSASCSGGSGSRRSW